MLPVYLNLIDWISGVLDILPSDGILCHAGYELEDVLHKKPE